MLKARPLARTKGHTDSGPNTDDSDDDDGNDVDDADAGPAHGPGTDGGEDQGPGPVNRGARTRGAESGALLEATDFKDFKRSWTSKTRLLAKVIFPQCFLCFIFFSEKCALFN